MATATYHEADKELLQLLADLERSGADEMIIARRGAAIARLTPVGQTAPPPSSAGTKVRLGLARGRFVVPDDIDADNAKIADLFAPDAS